MLKRILAATAAFLAATMAATAGYYAPGSTYTGVVQGSYPRDINVMDARFGAVCDVVEKANSSGTSSTQASNTVTTKGTLLKVGEYYVQEGAGHVTGASDLYVNAGNSSINNAGTGGTYAIGNTITLTGGTVLTVQTVTGNQVATFSVSTYATYTLAGATATLSQTASSGSGTGFVLNAIYNGPSYSGTVASTGGSAGNWTATITPVTNMTMGASHSLRLWIFIPVLTTPLRSTMHLQRLSSPVRQMYLFRVMEPEGLSPCGIATGITLPANSLSVGNNPWLVGNGPFNGDIYVLAPMARAAYANGTNSFGGGIQGITFNLGGLVTTAGVQIVGIKGFSFLNNVVQNGTGSVSEFEVGDGATTTAEMQANFNKIYVDTNSFSGGQMPSYNINVTSTGVDGYYTNDVLADASSRNMIISAPDTHVTNMHIFETTIPNVRPVYAIDSEANTVYLTDTHLDNALGTSGGIFVGGYNNHVVSTIAACSVWTPIDTPNMIEIGNGQHNDVVVGVSSVASSCGLAGAKLVVADGSNPGLVESNMTGGVVAGTGVAATQTQSQNLSLNPSQANFAGLGTAGYGFSFGPEIFNDTTSESPALVHVHRLQGPVINSATANTYAVVNTLEIDPPTASGSATVTAANALYLGGNINMNGNQISKITNLINTNAAGFQLATGSCVGSPCILPDNADAKAGVGADASGDVSLYADNAGTKTEAVRTTGALTTLFLPTTMSSATIKMTALAASTAADVMCYATATGLLTYEPTGTTCTVSALRFKDVQGSVNDAEPFIDSLHIATGHFKKQFQKDYGTAEHVWILADEVCAGDKRLCARDPDGKIRSYDRDGVLAYAVRRLQEEGRAIDWLMLAIALLALWCAGLTVIAVRRRG